MTKRKLEKIIDGINTTPIVTPKLPAGGFSTHCKDWCKPQNDILKDVLGNPIAYNQVVAVIDSANKNSTTGRYDGGDVPESIPEVVVAVGINYGQIGTSRGIVKPWYDDTKMRGRLKKVYDDLALPLDATNRTQVVLIATNFFPWLSSDKWNDIKLNAIEEMLLIYSAGFSDPFLPISDLVQGLNNMGVFPHLVFHGANNAVPLMGRIAVETVLPKYKFKSVVFCDNLAHGSGISNAVLL